MYITHYYQFLYDLSNYIGAIFFLFLPPPSSHILKNKVHYSWKFFSPSCHPRWICFFMGIDLEKCSITSLAHQWILCSEWVPSDVNCWAGVVWITCGLLWCFYQLFGLNLTAPIHCRGSIGEQVMQCSKSVPMKKQTHLHLEHFQQIFIFGWTVSLRTVYWKDLWGT